MKNYIASTKFAGSLGALDGQDFPLLNTEQIQAKSDGTSLHKFLQEMFNLTDDYADQDTSEEDSSNPVLSAVKKYVSQLSVSKEEFDKFLKDYILKDEEDNGKLDKLQEILEWIGNYSDSGSPDETGAFQVIKDINAMKASLKDLSDKENGRVDDLQALIDNLKNSTASKQDVEELLASKLDLVVSVNSEITDSTREEYKTKALAASAGYDMSRNIVDILARLDDLEYVAPKVTLSSDVSYFEYGETKTITLTITPNKNITSIKLERTFNGITTTIAGSSDGSLATNQTKYTISNYCPINTTNQNTFASLVSLPSIVYKATITDNKNKTAYGAVTIPIVRSLYYAMQPIPTNVTTIDRDFIINANIGAEISDKAISSGNLKYLIKESAQLSYDRLFVFIPVVYKSLGYKLYPEAQPNFASGALTTYDSGLMDSYPGLGELGQTYTVTNEHGLNETYYAYMTTAYAPSVAYYLKK